jgi:hypothetical protein
MSWPRTISRPRSPSTSLSAVSATTTPSSPLDAGLTGSELPGLALALLSPVVMARWYRRHDPLRQQDLSVTTHVPMYWPADR